MNESEQIITLARHYCIDNHKYWAVKYQNERTGSDFPYTYSDTDYDIFPRYNALDAILKGIEIIVGSVFSNVEECKSKLKEIANSSNTIFTKGQTNNIEANAIEDERRKFVHFIDNLNLWDGRLIEPLPYRRRLLEVEATDIRNSLHDNWNFDGTYWEPLNNCSTKPFIFFNKENLDIEDFIKIKTAILTHTNRIYEITEQGYDYEIDNIEFDADCYETVFTDRSFDWIVYGSHEGTLAFGGDWLLTELTNILHSKRDYINKW
jgi:hypothetical protein